MTTTHRDAGTRYGTYSDDLLERFHATCTCGWFDREGADDEGGTTMALFDHLEAETAWRREKVTTWADGYGNWKAQVNFADDGYGPAHLDAHFDRIRAKARRAIRRELEARGLLGYGHQVRVKVVDNNLDHMNVMHSITFAEVVR